MAEYIDKTEIGAKIQASYIRREAAYGYTHDFTRGMRKALKFIEDMPAADVQPVNRWISVEDRLPEEIGYYLVVIGNEILVSIDIAEYSENRWHKHDKVLYWQPLPDYPEAIKED